MIVLTPGEEFEAWLQSLSTTALRTFATRSALRALPYAFSLSNSTRSFNLQQLLLACFRGNIVSGLVGIGLSEETSALSVDALETLNAANNTDALSTLVDPNDTIPAIAATFYSTRADDGQIIHDLMADMPTYGMDSDRALIADAEALTAAPENTAKLFATELWHGAVPEPFASLSQQFFGNAPGTPWEFWAEWYKGMLNGNPLDWELQRRVALIDNAIWLLGPEAIAKEISRIELPQQIVGRSLDQTASQVSRSPTLVSSIRANRDAITVSAVSLIEQIENFRERVRGLNTLEPRLREEVVEFADYLESSLSELVNALPIAEDELNEDSAGRIALWLRNYKDVLLIKLAHYSSPENVAEATVPTSIVLGSTAIGAMLGLPLVGAAVGGLITNQLKPAQAAKELLKRTEVEETGNK